MLGLGEAVVGEIVGKVAEALARRGIALLKGQPAQRAFVAALKEAVREFSFDNPEWTSSLFDERFLSQRCVPILANALTRDGGPTDEQMAQAYADQFYGGAAGRPDLVAKMRPIAADFLLRFDLALRRQDALRLHFDSKAGDATVGYLRELLGSTRSQWAESRSFRVTDALDDFLAAALHYEEAGHSIYRGQPIHEEALLNARVLSGGAGLRLVRMKYSELARLRGLFHEMVVDRYDNVAEGEDFWALEAGVLQFQQLLETMAPI